MKTNIVSDHTLYDGNKILANEGGIGQEGIVHESFYDGETMFTHNTVYKNKLLLIGRTFLIEKANNVRSNFRPTPIDQDLSVSAVEDIDISIANLKEEEVIGFVIGTGGSGDTRNTLKAVEIHHKNVPDQIPFRVIDMDTETDLTGSERAQYFLRKVVDNKAYYYGKVITAKEIKTVFANSIEVPADVHNQLSPDEILNYIEYQIDISDKDVREYFLDSEGSVNNARFNSIGLVTGYPVTLPDTNIEYRNVRCNTTLNTDNIELRNALSTATYRYQYLLK